MRSNTPSAVPTYTVLRHRAGNPSGLDLQISGVSLDNFVGTNLSMDSNYRGLNLPTRAIVEEAIVAGVITDLVISNGQLALTYVGNISSFLNQVSARLGLSPAAASTKRGAKSRR